jgi:hypothetical protein
MQLVSADEVDGCFVLDEAINGFSLLWFGGFVVPGWFFGHAINMYIC